MHGNRSPPRYSKLNMGGSANNLLTIDSDDSVSIRNTPSAAFTGNNSVYRSGSNLSLYSNSSGNKLLAYGSGERHSHYSGHSRSGSSAMAKRSNKNKNWGNRERAGMSFLIVIAFFAVFGLIILTELFMIDERSHGGMVVQWSHSGYGFGGRMSDSMPDYDNVKDDYDLLDDGLMSDSKLGFVQFRDNKFKIQDADSAATGRLAGILLNTGVGGHGAVAAGAERGGNGAGNSMPLIPWGKVLPANIEETLPPFPVGLTPMDGAWQVVNGTRFKFFVFSAYYDRRDGARMVRIVGATKTRGPERVVCRFWYPVQRNSTATKDVRMHRNPYTSATVSARVKIIRENWNLKYSACFVLCPVRVPDLEVPHYVSVVTMSRMSLRSPPGNLLDVRNTDWDRDFITQPIKNASGLNNNTASTSATDNSSTMANFTLPTGDKIADKIAVCVKPFHFNYDQSLYLMEYLEFYALLGVSHFTFYNHTMGPHATCVLEHYMRGDIPTNISAADEEQLSSAEQRSQTEQDIQRNAYTNSSRPAVPMVAKHIESKNYVAPTVNILPWNLRMRSQKEIRTEGLFAALNDCLYRTMYRYKYLALVDLDEFIVPRHNDTLKDLINSLNQRFRNRDLGAYSFQNAFFYLQFSDDPLVSQLIDRASNINPRLRAALVTQRKTRRRFKLHPQKQRSKYICKPEAVIEAGNHFVWEFSPGKGSLNVPPTEAILQHYRVCEFGGNDCVKAPSVVDRTATKYVNRLVQRVESVYNHLKTPCKLPDLPVLPELSSIEEVENDIKNMKEKQIKSNKPKETKLNNEKLKTKSTMTIAMLTKTATTTPRIKNPFPAANIKTLNTTTMGEAKNIKDNEKNNSTNKNNLRKRRKIIVFAEGEDGSPKAQVQYV